MKAFFRGVLVAILATVFIVDKAPAGVLEFGMGARGVAMGQAQVAAANDLSAMTYNPAALAYARQYWDLQTREYFVQVNKVGTHSMLYINGDEQRDPYASAIIGGAIIPLTRNLTAGIQVYYPSDTTILFELFRGPSIPRYRSWRWFYVIVGGCYQITDKLSVGGAANLTLNFNASSLNLDIMSIVSMLGFDLGGANYNINPAFHMQVLLTPSYEVGALYRPTKWLNLGAFYRYRLGTKLEIPITIPQNILFSTDTHVWVKGYMFVINPPQFSVGAAVYPNKNLTLAFDMQYDMWSSIQPGLTFSSDSGLFGGDNPVEVKLHDVWWPKFGVEWKDSMGGKYSRAEYAVRAGYSFYTSPYPSKVPSSENIDNDAHYMSGGFSLGYHPRRRAEYVSLDYYYQYVDLVEREYKNIHSNPSTLISDGYVIYQGFGVTVML